MVPLEPPYIWGPDIVFLARIRARAIDFGGPDLNMHIFDLFIKYRGIDTFLGPFFEPDDRAMLKATCKQLYALFKRNYKPKCPTIDIAAKFGHYYLLVTYFCGEIDIGIACVKCSGRDFEAQKIIIGNYKSDQLCHFAAKNGHLELLKWARENGAPWNEWTCVQIAKNGHFEVLKWARANGCPWDEETCEYAAKKGHLEILKWARENGCPWDECVCTMAAKNGHLELLKWAQENGAP